MTTIKSIAAKAGVSSAAVSYVLRGRAVRMRPETRARILATARELDYQPNSLVHALQTKRTHVIGVLLPNLEVSFFPQIIAAMETAAGAHGFQVLIAQSHSSADRAEEQIRLFREKRVDGLLVTPAPQATEFYGRLLQSGVRMVFVDQGLPSLKVPCVRSDDVLGAKLAVRHLIALGHRRIATFRWPTQWLATNMGVRFEGYRLALREAGLVAESGWIQELRALGDDALREATLRIVKARRCTAIFAATDMEAMTAISTIHDAGLRVPEDIAVMGYANLREGAYFIPKLSTVDQNPGEIGTRAVERLVDMIENPTRRTPQRELTTPALVIRESCGAALGQRDRRAVHPTLEGRARSRPQR